MALVFTVALVVSIVGMLMLLMMKRYELNTGRIFMAASRPAIGGFFHHKLVWIEYVLPGLIRVGIKRTYVFVRRVLRVWTIRIAIKLETALEKALSRVRHTTLPARRGQSSAFLREVAEHKKKLQKELPEERIVVED